MARKKRFLLFKGRTQEERDYTQAIKQTKKNRKKKKEKKKIVILVALCIEMGPCKLPYFILLCAFS